MSQRFESSRLLLEVVALVALAQVALRVVLSTLAPGVTGVAAALLNIALLVLLVGPALFWRYMAARQRTARAQGQWHHSEVRAPLAMAAAALLAGLALTMSGMIWRHQDIETVAKAKFERFSERIESELIRRFRQPAYGVNGIAGFYAGSKSVERGEFRAYVAARDLAAEFPGARGFGFIQRVMRADLDRFIAAERADEAPDFVVRSSGDASDLYVVKFIEPLSNSRAAWGLDLGSEGVAREAMERAVDTGLPTLASRIALPYNDSQDPGLLYFRPVYRNGSVPTTPQQRRAALVGLLYSPLVVAEIMAGVTNVAEQLLHFELFDGAEMTGSMLLFDSDQHLNVVHGNPVAGHFAGKLIPWSRQIAVGGHALTLRVSTTPAFEAGTDRSATLAGLGIGGVLLSFLLALTVWLLASSRVRAQVLAQLMTADLGRLAKVVQHTSNAVTITDRQLRITWVNPGFTRITGYTLNEALGRTPDELLSSGKSDPAMLEILQETTTAGGSCRVQLLNRAKDGREYWVDTEIQPMLGADGKLNGFMEIGLDITERKQSEEALKEAMREAEHANVAKSQFLANMSHEIRTPMNAILGMLKLLQNTPLTSRQLDYATKSEGAARALLGLLNDILDFSKVEAGKLTLDPRPFRVERMLTELSVIMAASVGSKNVDVLFDIDPAVPQWLFGDDLRLQQILINLGGNAIKFTPQGEVVLRIRLAARREGAVRLEFSMRDTGVGIAPEHQVHIFQVFSQAEASTTRRYGGTGLGLAISQRLVEMMGGKLMLESAPGMGSNFHFNVELPIVETQAHESASSPSLEVASLHALIVDDNATARETFAAMARSLKWHADVAANGAEAVALIEASAGCQSPYQVVFIDWQIPGMDGWSTCLRIRELLGSAVILVAMIAGRDRDALAERCAKEPFLLSGLLVKPINSFMMFEAVVDAHAALADLELAKQRVPAGQHRLAGMRLLVVEDNFINQQVAQELLTCEGAVVELADNGVQGVAAVAAADPPFDAVLMDIQMPLMDGYTATAEIRYKLGRTALPIIAITANAMTSGREACLAAGMNDHIGKPFDLSHVIATLLRHTGRTAMSQAVPAPLAPTLPADLGSDAARLGIDLQGALSRLGGNPDIYLRMLQSFLRKDLVTAPGQLASYLQRGQRVEAGQLMHTVKGVAATLGANRLAVFAKEAELGLSEAASPEQAAQWIASVDEAVRAASAEITQVAERLQQAHTPATGPAPGGATLEQGLGELEGLLRSANMRAVDVFAQLQLTHAAILNPAGSALDDAMAELDFRRALEHCQDLQRTLRRDLAA